MKYYAIYVRFPRPRPFWIQIGAEHTKKPNMRSIIKSWHETFPSLEFKLVTYTKTILAEKEYLK